MYRRPNPFHFAGSCPNHLRRASLGPRSRIQASILSFSFVTPRGHSRSTSTRDPSPEEGGSYARFNWTTIFAFSAVVRRAANAPQPPPPIKRDGKTGRPILIIRFQTALIVYPNPAHRDKR